MIHEKHSDSALVKHEEENPGGSKVKTENCAFQVITTRPLSCHGMETWQFGNSLINYMKLVSSNYYLDPTFCFKTSKACMSSIVRHISCHCGEMLTGVPGTIVAKKPPYSRLITWSFWKKIIQVELE
jgi:hypothetical protein